MDIKNLSGFEKGAWPCTYLGIPSHVGRVRIGMFDPLITKVHKTLAGWKGRLVSFGGKLILIKHVLSSLPIHMLSVLNLPKGVFSALKGIFSNFLWGSTIENRKRKWISWRKICLPIEEGGLGIRWLSEVQNSLLMKFAWKILQGGSLWARFFSAKYVGDKHIFSSINLRKGYLGSRRGLCEYANGIEKFQMDYSRRKC